MKLIYVKGRDIKKRLGVYPFLGSDRFRVIVGAYVACRFVSAWFL